MIADAGILPALPMLAALTFLSGWAGVIAAGIAIPSLLLLYFLKLRRTERVVSSTLLWKRAVHDLQVNSPFQKLRRNLLLFLQLLILAAIILAIAHPMMNFDKRPEKNIVVLIDRSASMKTLEADGRPRLDHAKDAATDFIKGVPADSRVMVIAFADRADVACSFTDDKRRLERSIRDLSAVDGRTKIGEALQLAVAYSSQFVDERTGTPEAARAGSSDIRLFTDGRIDDAAEQAVVRGEVKYYRVGQAADNVGIVGFDVRRDYERPGVLSVFAQVENFGPKEITTDVSIRLDGRLLPGPGSIQQIKLGPAATSTSGPSSANAAVAEPSSRNVIFELAHDSGGVVEVRLHREDTLACDNIAYAPVDPPRELRVLVVCDRERPRRVLERVLRSVSVNESTWMAAADYEKAPDDQLILDGRSKFDLVILDNHDTGRLPPGNYLMLGGVPKIDGVSAGADVEGQSIVSWQENHPLLRPADFSNVYISKWRRLTLPPTAAVLVEGEDSPVIASLSDPGHRYVMTAFDLEESNFAITIPFVFFMQNCTRALTNAAVAEAGRIVAPGDTVTINVPAGANEAEIKRPDGGTEETDVAGRATLTYAKTQEAGIYRFKFDDPAKTTESYAANTLSPTESRVAPNDDLRLAQTPVESSSSSGRVNESLWPHLAAAALLILFVEWWIYNRRVMI